MNFRRVCNITAGLALLIAIALYLLPWLLTVPSVSSAVSADGWHQGHGVFARSVALVLLVAGLLVWGIRNLSGQAQQMGVSASLSIACVFGVAALAYLTLTGAAAAQIDSLGMPSSVSRVAANSGLAPADHLAPRPQADQSAARTAAASLSASIVWLIAGFLGLVGVLFGVNIMPAENRRSRGRARH